MNHLEFARAGLHNRHIRFLIDGEIFSGVVVDDPFHTEGKTTRTDYTFIPAENMVKWKEAEQKNDRETMTSLSSVINIEKIVWGEPTNGKDTPIGGIEFVEYLCKILKKREDLFRNPSSESILTGSDYRVDISVERKNGKIWDLLFLEVKSFSTFTSSKLHDAIEQIKDYKTYSQDAKFVLVFPGILPAGDNHIIQSEGIEVWDINFIATTFAKEIANTPHPVLQSLFTKANYSSTKDILIQELKSIRTGKKKDNEWSKYQKYVERVLEHLFGKQLSSPITEHSDHFKLNRRDFILRNYAETGFWAHLRTRYLADYVVIDAKNHTNKVTKKEILQISNYLKEHGPGLFGLIISRNGGDKSCYYTCREIWAMDKKLIIVLDDNDLTRMIIAKETLDNPEEIIRQHIEHFRLSM